VSALRARSSRRCAPRWRIRSANPRLCHRGHGRCARVIDAEQLGGHLPASLLALGPTLSGVVYEDTPAGRLPVPDAGVILDSLYGLGLVIADTGTDADSRYVLCGVPDVPGLTLQVSASGYQPAELAATGTSTLDVPLRR